MNSSLISGYLSLFHLDLLPVNQFSRLLKSLGTLSAIADADAEQLAMASLEPKQRKAIQKALGSTPTSTMARNCQRWLEEAENRYLVCFEDSLYPPLLREIHLPPPILFISGDPATLCLPQVAIVGSRNASLHGKQTANWIARELAMLGLCICSGLAHGIDTQAHQGALAAKDGKTIAVMGTGADQIYPGKNRNLAERVSGSGALITEYSLGSPPIADHFPRRNRIISGMSLGVVVIEAALRSGSLITARLALEQHREVFAVPGSIQNPLAAGCHRLIRDGAKLADSVEAITEELSSLLTHQMEETEARLGESKPKLGKKDRSGLSKDEKKLLDAIGWGECPLDSLTYMVDLDVQTIGSLLSGLELKGFIVQQSGRFRQVARTS